MLKIERCHNKKEMRTIDCVILNFLFVNFSISTQNKISRRANDLEK